MKIITISIALFISTLSISQKNDYNWMLGGSNGYPDVKDGIKIDFNNGSRQLIFEITNYSLDQQIASISDENGHFLFYSNGCNVIDADHELIENGDSLNYGEWWAYINDCKYGYTVAQNMIILPDPGNKDGYYIIHKRYDIYINDTTIVGNTDLLYTYVLWDRLSNTGKVVEKNKSFFARWSIVGGFLHAVKHENGRDWWIVQMEDRSNKYFSLLLDPAGFHLVDSIQTGIVFERNVSAGGQGKFSPDGSKWAMYSNDTGVILFDFDRSTGKMSNYQNHRFRDKNSFTGLEFSASGRFVYISVLDTLFQLDITEPNLAKGLRVVGIWDGSSNPFQTTFSQMQRGPDCRIYMSSVSSTRTIHVINNPDGLGADCDFRQHALDLNGLSTGSLSMPTFPNYRLGSGPVCDPSITTSTEAIFQPVQPVMIWPNPAHDIIHLDVPEDHSNGIYQIYDISGRLVMSATIHRLDTGIDISSLSKGIYVVRYIDKEGGAYSGKVVVE